MAFVLLGIGGPAAGIVRKLGEGPLTIGRGEHNGLRLPDAAVSRHHCVLEVDNGGIHLRDPGSFNGTYVNGARVSEALLRHGDEIRICTSLFRILDDQLDSDPDCRDAPAGASVVRTHRIEADPESPFELEQLARRLYRQERTRAELAALLELASALPPTSGFAEAKRIFLEAVFRIVPAERAALLMLDPSTGAMTASYGWKRGTGPVPPECVPESAVAHCLDEKAGVMAEVQGLANSLWLCPLPCNDGIAGVLALETTGGEEIKPRYREWLCAAGRIAGGLLLCQHELERLRRANQGLMAEMDARRLIVGDSAAIAAVKEQIVKAAPSDATVLITGETGVGKEPVARAIHAGSARAHGPFVAVNCAALSPTLLESDLFGHERGAFTGAVALKRGRMEAAAGGTLFLDEIGELDAGIQARLLRVLQEREFERVGGLTRLRADIRLIAATNRNLAEEVERGAFRKDLYYRINVVAIHVPPLRERRADIPLLAAHFLSLSCAPAARRLRGLSPKARRRMMAYDWPGNVRELQNAIEHAIVFSRGEWIEEEDLPESLLEPAAPESASEPGYYSSLREAKRRILLAALAESGGSQQEAARRLGLNPSHLSRLIRSLGLRSEAGSMR